ncbi:hypothetical protein E6H18_03845 [Candidatus Bathyarchaeota archaeon]|nr:MAG: hypothetical protein E6H18_03845 [Candidatus Bathyarchaeota archaeon]
MAVEKERLCLTRGVNVYRQNAAASCQNQWCATARSEQKGSWICSMMFRTRPRVFVLPRRWKLTNHATGIRAKISHGKVSMGYGHLEKTLAADSRWRTSHREIAKIEDEINALQWPTIPKRVIIEPGKKD